MNRFYTSAVQVMVVFAVKLLTVPAGSLQPGPTASGWVLRPTFLLVCGNVPVGIPQPMNRLSSRFLGLMFCWASQLGLTVSPTRNQVSMQESNFIHVLTNRTDSGHLVCGVPNVIFCKKHPFCWPVSRLPLMVMPVHCV